MQMASEQKGQWPKLFQRYLNETGPVQPEYLPRRVRRRFHGKDVTCWQGYVHFADIQGYVENLRLKFYLNKWRSELADPAAIPTTQQIYEIMIEADKEESKDLKKPFHVERMADNIARNGIQEPIVLFYNGTNAELWDGNRRFFGTMHIMHDDHFKSFKEQAQWLPAFVVEPSGSAEADGALKQRILTELNFVEKDHIPWPAYVKAEQIHQKYYRAMAADPTDPVLSRTVKGQLAGEYGLKGWRVADRWIKMYDLALQFREYHEEEYSRPTVDVDLKIQERFEYFDELSKPGVWGAVSSDPDARDEVFCWLWDGKFQAFPNVREVPRILADPVARRQANAPDVDAVKRAIQTVIANDPTRIKDKEAANEKIAHFAAWVDSFKREDFNQLSTLSLENLKKILEDVTSMLGGLLSSQEKGPRPI